VADRRAKISMLAAVALAAAGTAAWVAPEGAGGHAPGLGEGLQVLTALGGIIWGMPADLSEFGIDRRSATGALVLACLAAALARAWRRRMLSRIALPLSFAAFGLLCLASVALGRGYLGNWHLQYGLPVVCGAYACAYGVWREQPRAAGARIPFAALALVLLASAAGSARAFAQHGPKCRSIARRIEKYALLSLREPDLEKPFPPAPELGHELVLYLAAKGRGLFEGPPLRKTTREAQGERVFVDGEELLPPRTLGPSSKRRRITLLLPPSSPAGGLRLEIGGATLRLHEIHPRLAGVPGSDEARCFAALLLPEGGEEPRAVRVLIHPRSSEAPPTSRRDERTRG
jgi:hypothetical protein